VVQRVSHAIQLGLFVDGEQLPPETEFAAASLGPQIRADSRFHIEVARTSQSQRLTHLEVELQTQLGELLWLPPEEAAATAVAGAAEPLDPVAAAAEHAAIADAIAAEQGNQARELAERHVEANLRRLTALRLAMARRGDKFKSG
jgi:GntR family transcriptional regulator, transcriptional repressor for pyruvate dehydrogenase complex